MYWLPLALLFCSLQLATAATHSFDFHISQQEVQISPGIAKFKTVVNGMFPGPLVRVPYNANLEMNLYNDLHSNSTTIHWHGMHQRGTPYFDGYPTISQCPIGLQDSLTYKFKAYPSGSSFWHAHMHEESVDGVYGPLIVEDQPGGFPYSFDEEKVILLTDAYDATSWEIDPQIIASVVNSVGSNEPVLDPEPSRGLVCVYDETKTPATPSCSSTSDGRGFDLNFERGKTYRLRLICSAALAPFLFSIDGHEMQVVAVDYSVTDGSTWVKGVPLTTGQRYDVLVRARDDVDDGAKFWVRSTLGGDLCRDYLVEKINTDVRGIVTYGGIGSSSLPDSTSWEISNPYCLDLDYSVLKPLPSTPSPPPLSDEEPTLMFLNFTFPGLFDGLPAVLINGQSFNVSDDAYPTLFHIQENPNWKPTEPGEQRNIFTIPDSLRGKQIRLVIRSVAARDGGGHPFHSHGRGSKVLATGSSEFTQEDLDNITADDVLNAITRDTVIVPRNGWVITQFEAKNPGVWGLHCHIAWHVNLMVGQIVELPQAISEEIKIPQKMKDACRRFW
jgi:FtsP/CotA-like multicopper oxidase with cupredoxin domain